MPIYEYRRPDGSTFEMVQSFSEDALTKDPDSGVPVERVLHAPAVHFKGKGFYNTDYGTRKRQRETAASADNSSSSDSSAGESSASGGTDSSSKGDSASKPDSKKAESGSKADSKSDASSSGKSKPVVAAK